MNPNSKSSSDFHTAVVNIAVAQICNSVGYTTANSAALETLTRVAVTYLQSLATAAAASATSTGRTHCNLYDVIRALEDLHSAVGFQGNSDLNRRLYSLADSSIVRDLMRFVYSTREIPFAKPLPRRVHTRRNPAGDVSESGTSAVLRHVPRWLPSFPTIHAPGLDETVAHAPVIDKTAVHAPVRDEKVVHAPEMRRLPERRKAVRFRISGGGRSVNSVENLGDLRSGVCKMGKRISCTMYDDDDEKFVKKKVMYKF